MLFSGVRSSRETALFAGVLATYWPVFVASAFYCSFLLTSRHAPQSSTVRQGLLSAAPSFLLYLWALLTAVETWRAWYWITAGAVEVAGIGLRASLGLGLVLPALVLFILRRSRLRLPELPIVGVFTALVATYTDILFLAFMVTPRR